MFVSVRDWSLVIAEKHLTVIGTSIIAFSDRYPQAILQLLQWVKEVGVILGGWV